MKKTVVFLILVSAVMALGASDLVVKGADKMVKTAPVQTTDRVYLGSFLANGWLPASDA
jgi:hypothetical protein